MNSLQTLTEAASSLVSKFGGPATYTQVVTGAYNPDTGTAAQMVTDVPVTACLLDLTLQSNGYSTKFGTLVQAGDKEAYVIPPPGGLTINPATDTLTYAGIVWKVVTFKEISTPDERMVYFLYLRR